MSAKDRYRLFASSCPELPLCFQPWYLDAATEEGGWDVVLAEEKGRILGVWTYFLKRKFGLQYITMPHFTKWMGPWLVPEARRRLTDEHRILETLRLQLPPVWKITVDCHPEFGNWLPLYWAGFRQTTRYTYVLNLDDWEKVQQGFNRNVQRNLRKAEASVSVSQEGNLQEFHALLRMSFDRQDKPLPYSFVQLQSHLESLLEHGAARLFFARNPEGGLCSVAALTWDQQRAYYHLSGDDPAQRAVGSGILLVWEAIRYAHEALQAPLFDFEGSMMPSVEAVRRSFGAAQQPYFRIWKPLW